MAEPLIMKELAAPPSSATRVSIEEESRRSCRDLASIIDRIGDKWTVMVVGHLSNGPVRFNELRRRIPGISHRMLTLTLRGLERDGLVIRRAFASIPPRVEYELSEMGASLREPLVALARWAEMRQGTIQEARAAYDRSRELASEL
jgi:DNA-binding HxlR family transcriptional regulator